MELFNLKGKTAIVTGGATGLARQMAFGLAEAGANMVVCSRKLERCQEAAQKIESVGVKALALRCDLNREDEIDHVVKETIKEFGKIDILVNNSGRTWGASVEELELENWKKVIECQCDGDLSIQSEGRERDDQAEEWKDYQYRLLCWFDRN